MEDRLSDMSEGLHKARSGLIRALVKTKDGKIEDIIISGDYIMTPERCIDELEAGLIGTEANEEKILSKLKEFYESNSFQCPETHPEDFLNAIMKAIHAGGSK